MHNNFTGPVHRRPKIGICGGSISPSKAEVYAAAAAITAATAAAAAARTNQPASQPPPPHQLPSSVPITSAPTVDPFSRAGASAPVSAVATANNSRTPVPDDFVGTAGQPTSTAAAAAIAVTMPPIKRGKAAVRSASAPSTPSIDRHSSFENRTPTPATGSNGSNQPSPSAPQRSDVNDDKWLSKNNMNPDDADRRNRRRRQRKLHQHRRHSSASDAADVGRLSANTSQVVVVPVGMPFAQAVGDTGAMNNSPPASEPPDPVVVVVVAGPTPSIPATTAAAVVVTAVDDEPMRIHRRQLSDALAGGVDAQKALLALAALSKTTTTITTEVQPIQPAEAAFTPRPASVDQPLPGTMPDNDDDDDDDNCPNIMPTPAVQQRRRIMPLSSNRMASSSNLLSAVNESSAAQLRLNIISPPTSIDSHRGYNNGGASTTRSTGGLLLPSPSNLSKTGLASPSTTSVEFKTGRYLAGPSPTGSQRFDPSASASKFGSGVSLAQRFGSAVVNNFGLATPSGNTGSKNAALRGSLGSARLPAVEPLAGLVASVGH